MDFRVGDIIKGTIRGRGVYGYTNEDMYEAEVLRVEDSVNVQIKILKHMNSTHVGEIWTVETRYFDLVKSAKIEPAKRDIKIGDKVKMISERPRRGKGEVEYGDIGIVTRIDSSVDDKGLYPIYLDFDAQHGWTGYADELELVSEVKSIPVEVEDVKEINGFHVGDIFKKTSKVGGYYTHFEVIELIKPSSMKTKIVGNCSSDSSIGKEYTMTCDPSNYIHVTDKELYNSFKVGDVVTAASVIKTESCWTANHKLGMITAKSLNSFNIFLLESLTKNDAFLNAEIYAVEANNIKYVRAATNAENRLYKQKRGIKEEPIAVPILKEDEKMALSGRGTNPFAAYPQPTVLTTDTCSITTKIDKKEGKSIMNINAKTFGLGNIGVDKSGAFKLSMLGLAIANSQGDWVVYNPEESVMVNVCDMVMDTKDMVFRLPVQTVEVGDLIIHQGSPVYVTAKSKTNRITVLNPLTDKEETIVPQKNILGFNFHIKVVSMLNMLGFNGAVAGDNPMAMMMPMMLMSGEGFGGSKSGEGMGMMEMMMMSQFMGGQQTAGANPMANMLPMMFLMGDKKGGDGMGMMEMLMMGQMFGGNGGFNLGTMFGGAPVTTVAAPKAASPKKDPKAKKVPTLPAGETK